MADTDDQPPQAVQTPGRAVQKTAPGVFSYRDAPIETGASLHTGDVVGGRFVVERYLGSSGGGVSYLSVDQKSQKEVVVKVLTMDYPGDDRFNGMATFIRTASKVQHPNLTRLLGMGKTDAGEIFVALEFVRGATLSNIIRTRREQNAQPNLYDVFTILAHACDALTEVHDAGMTHAVLTPYNVYLDSQGVVRVGNFGFGLVTAKHSYEENEGPFVDSIYVAPEVPEAPELISSAVDIYSLGMIAAEMLSPEGLPSDRDEAKAEAIMLLSKYPSDLSQLIAQSLGEDLASRPRTAQSFRDQLRRSVEAAGVDLFSPPEGSLPIQPAIEQADVRVEENLFDIPELAGLGVERSDPSSERYLLQKNGLDYGPFGPEEVLRQLYADEIDENTPVLDRVTTDRVLLGEMSEFKAKVDEYVPKREERRRLEAERRAELQRAAKKGGVGLLIAGIAFALFFLTAQVVYFFTRPDPQAIPMGEAFATLDFKFLPPPKEFTSVAVDNELLQSIFNPKASDEEIARVIKKRRKASGNTKRKKPKRTNGKSNGNDSNVTEVDMSSITTGHILSDGEVNDVILANFGGLRSCILSELKTNTKYRGSTVKFFIRPTGTTGGVKVKGGGSEVSSCLKSKFRRMKFPEHGGFNRGVTYPLRVQ